MSKIKLPKSIKMIITDFDGIVTDNCVYINEDFTMSRKLNFKDVMGFSILKKNGYENFKYRKYIRVSELRLMF